MMFPSTSVIILGVVLVAALMTLDWYVWGATYASDFSLPRRETRAKAATPPVAEAEHEDAGFKHVA